MSIFPFRNPEVEQSALCWQQFLSELPDDGTVDAWRIAVTDFLIPDKINYKKFSLNWEVVFRGMTTNGCSPSAKRFQFAAQTPLGYPKWFLAGYPDVAAWFTSIADMSVDDAEKVQQWYVQTLKLEPNESFVEGHPPYIKPKHLRTMIQAYQQQTNRKLECVCSIAKFLGM